MFLNIARGKDRSFHRGHICIKFTARTLTPNSLISYLLRDTVSRYRELARRKAAREVIIASLRAPVSIRMAGCF